ncbi:MAG: Uncharacterized protein FD153_1705 [Rhodospirillaceae bacterium]|nr:MAG: Uncharacterized protein FD153_1705 [Rhodospirillaceae bacterium]
MHLVKVCVVLLSAGLFGYVLVCAEAVEVGVTGTGVVLGLYLAVFILDSFSWHLTVSILPLRILWLYRLWKVRMVGEAFNMVLPAGGMGGEPVKAILMKSRHGLDYRDSIASLILARTINLIALVFFLGIGFGLILLYPALPASLTTMAGVGLGGFDRRVVVQNCYRSSCRRGVAPH